LTWVGGKVVLGLEENEGKTWKLPLREINDSIEKGDGKFEAGTKKTQRWNFCNWRGCVVLHLQRNKKGC